VPVSAYQTLDLTESTTVSNREMTL